MKRRLLACLTFAVLLLPSITYAQGAAPELYGVKQVIIEPARLPDAKAADTCGLSEHHITKTLAAALEGTGVPAIPAAEAGPPPLGVARIDLVPLVYSRADDELNCTSWISLTAQNRVNAQIPPVTTLRSVTVVYWRQSTMAVGSQTTHAGLVDSVLKKMAAQFAQQYRVDQPPTLPK
ncbi:MAG: hypothetical protein KGI97_04720 [Alphaproteobacteria bacterium]|nr:hypothetical protein [Alphaproteobacteria bacterium]